MKIKAVLTGFHNPDKMPEAQATLTAHREARRQETDETQAQHIAHLAIEQVTEEVPIVVHHDTTTQH